MVVLFLILATHSSISQDVFKLPEHSKKTTMRFKLVSNLIIVPVQVNGSEMNLILDTGVKQTILINIHPGDSIKLQNLETVFFAGIGSKDVKIKGVKSKHNHIKVGKTLLNEDHTMYFIHDLKFDFSEKIGIVINGFIGGDLLKDFIVKINYRNKKLTFYKRDKFKCRKLRKYKKYDIDMIEGKPYINGLVEFRKGEKKKLKFLIDTGSSDAVWLFRNSRVKIPKNIKYIADYLGRGLSGNVNGRRTKMQRFDIDNNFKFKNVYVAFPDSTYTETVNAKKFYDGIIGNEIMRRFFVFLDYGNKKLYLKKYRGNYHEKFYYNISGISIAYGGKILVQEKTAVIAHDSGNKDNRVLIDYKYEYKLKPIYVITYVRAGSPAEQAGLIYGDVLLKVNGKPSYKYSLQELWQRFFYQNKKSIKLLIDRNGFLFEAKIKNIDVFRNVE